MKKVAIVGYTSTREQAPYGDDSFEIWGINDLYEYIPRFNRWFDIHSYDFIKNQVSSRTGRKQLEVLKSMPVPVYMQKKFKSIPNSVRYPFDEIVKYFSPYFTDPVHARYFTNSISFMLALAIYEGFQEIAIYGVDLAVTTEYSEQRPSCEFWIGVAVGRGIKVHIPLQSDLLKTRFIYGFEEKKQHAFEQKMNQVMADLEKKKAEMSQQLEQAKAMLNQYSGALQGCQEMMRCWR